MTKHLKDMIDLSQTKVFLALFDLPNDRKGNTRLFGQINLLEAQLFSFGLHKVGNGVHGICICIQKYWNLMQYMHLNIKNLSEAILYAFEYTDPSIANPTRTYTFPAIRRSIPSKMK